VLKTPPFWLVMVKTVGDMKRIANDRGTSATAALFLPTLAGGGEALRHLVPPKL
jgi:hypothetical protein